MLQAVHTLFKKSDENVSKLTKLGYIVNAISKMMFNTVQHSIKVEHPLLTLPEVLFIM